MICLGSQQTSRFMPMKWRKTQPFRPAKLSPHARQQPSGSSTAPTWRAMPVVRMAVSVPCDSIGGSARLLGAYCFTEEALALGGVDLRPYAVEEYAAIDDHA